MSGVDKHLVGRVRNWARYVRYYPSRAGSIIGSAEGRYRAPSDLSGDTEPRAIPPDERDGERVEAAVRSLEQQHRFLLKWTFVYPRAGGWVMRKLGRRGDAFKDRKMAALWSLAHALDEQARAGYKSSPSIAPSDARVAHVGDVSPEETEPVE